MTETPYRVLPAPKLKREWVGKRIITLAPLHTSVVSVPRGVRGTVQYHYRGESTLQLDACPCCGVAPRVKVRDDNGRFAFIDESPTAGLPFVLEAGR